MRLPITNICAILVSAAGLAACGERSNTTVVTESEVTAPTSIMQTAPVVTLDEFRALQPGMTYDQVSTIIGQHGETQHETQVLDVHTIELSWTNVDGGSMTASFQNGAMTTKSQTGLKVFSAYPNAGPPDYAAIQAMQVANNAAAYQATVQAQVRASQEAALERGAERNATKAAAEQQKWDQTRQDMERREQQGKMNHEKTKYRPDTGFP